MSTPLAATAVDAAALAEELARFRVLTPDRLSGLLADFPGGGPAALAEFLVARRALTPFQADRALAGEARVLALGPYRLTGLHRRRGTLGPVARSEKAGRGGGTFALRVMPLRSLWQAREAKKLARTLASLPAHPAVAPLVDADSANGYHYLVWPLVEGESLADRVKRAGPLPSAEAATLLAHLSSGLAACHARQVYHGLLSPHAVALAADPAGPPRLLELGAGALLAQNLAAKESLFDTLSAAVAVGGVIGFAAPEWVADPSRLTAAADQFSLGSVGYFALTGGPPPPAEPRPVAEVNSAVPAELGAVVDRLLHPDPADRFAGMDEVRDLFAALTGHQDLMNALCPPSERAGPAESRPADRSEAGRSGPRGGDGAFSYAPAARDDSDASIRFDLTDDLLEPTVGPVASRASRSSGTAGVGTVPEAALTDTPRTLTTQLPVALHAALPPDLVLEIHDPEFDENDASVSARMPAVPLPPEAVEPEPPPVRSRLLTRDGAGTGSAPPLLPAAPLIHDSGSLPALPAGVPDRKAAAVPKSDSVAWKALKRKVLFWQVPTDVVRVDVYGPAVVAHSQAPRLTVYLYPPAAADSVATLARAFQHEAVLLGTGTLAQPVARGARLAVHVAVDQAAVTSPLGALTWQGQPKKVTFDLVVPWEAAPGPVAGVVSVGKDDVRIGKAEFAFSILDG